MTVAELIKVLKTMPEDAPVSVGDEQGGNFHEDVGSVFFYPENAEFGDRACVIIFVNEDE